MALSTQEAIRNENLAFQELDPSVQAAFSSRRGTKVRLPAGTRLFRFSSHDGVSPWWGETIDLLDVLNAAKASKTTLYQFIQDRSAILRKWHKNYLHNLLIAELVKPVYGFQGLIGAQNEADLYRNPADQVNYKQRYTKPVYLRGGNNQVFIKDLSSADINYIVPLGTVTIHDKIDEIIDFLISYKLIDTI